MSEFGQESMWRDTATADAVRARDLAARLERRAKAEDEVAARDTYLGLLDIAAGERVLDVGCGSGVVTREIARRVGSHGLAVGLDPSPALLAVAANSRRGRAWAITWSSVKAMRSGYRSPTPHLTRWYV